MQRLKACISPSLVKYIVVGVLTNGLGYAAYLLLTSLGGEPKTVMTVLYIVGISINFYLNRRWTFRAEGSARKGFLKFLAILFVGYLLNLLWLILFVDTLGLPHQWVQGAAIFVMAVYFYVANKYIVHTS